MSKNITDNCCNNQHETQQIQMTDNKHNKLSLDLSTPTITTILLSPSSSTQTSQQQTQLPKLKSPNQQSFAKEIDYNEIEIKEVVGKGSFGVVRKGRWRNIDVAIKHINTESERIAFGIELVQLSRVSHPNIVRLYGACTKNPVCLVMEYAEGGSLYNVLHCSPKPHYTAGHAISWAVQCAQGVAYLHNMKPKPLIHRDLKPPNLLLVSGGRILKICDFGTACDLNTYMTNNKGSAAWMAPEVFEGSRYTEKCDIFSWGIILWEVLTRQKPFDDIGGSAYRIMWAVHIGQRPPLIEGCPKPIEYLITKCWAKIPEERPSMNEIVRIMTNLSELFNCDLDPVEYTPNSSINLEYINDNETNDDTINITWDTSNSQFNGDNSTSYNNNNNHQFNQDQLDILESINNIQSNTTTTAITPTGEQQLQQDITLRPPLSPMTPLTKLTTISSINSNNFQPLHIECDPTSWDLATSSDISWELGSTAGLDKMKPKSKKSIGKSSNSSNIDQLDEVYQLLDADLRPLEPDETCQISKDIFEEHKQLATEYFKVQTEIALISREKIKMLNSLSADGLRRQQELRKLEDEKESLVKFYRNLQRQLEIVKSPIRPGTVVNPNVQTTTVLPGSDGWVVVPRQEPSRIS